MYLYATLVGIVFQISLITPFQISLNFFYNMLLLLRIIIQFKLSIYNKLSYVLSYVWRKFLTVENFDES